MSWWPENARALAGNDGGVLGASGNCFG
ncbi:unnamed protein product [Chondrus crispus]|uniref:Uncharacterized protein n=1 Tax=Chondrus crispus TaxID=2769 RepID=R7Q3U3_CHOCR|nr:unnamed protein product [Chondrus crispus]CDF32528.1 unnamed protein product [Chondrus crispus]|eukprot:XP_005712193.1 unnamed protein product [Chondrus crispus]